MSRTAKDREIVVNRVIDAPRELVFEAFTEREHIEAWWAPRDARTEEIDVRPGGVWRYKQPGSGGKEYGFRIEFIEIERPTRLVYDYSSVADDGSEPVRTTVTFEEDGDQTNVTLRLLFATAADRQQAVKYGGIVGAMQALENLADYLAKK